MFDIPFDFFIDAGAFSPIAIFMHADIVVKFVLISLGLASVWSWAVMIDKSFRVSSIRHAADRFEDEFWKRNNPDEFYDHIRKINHPFAIVFVAAREEWRRVFTEGQVDKASITQRLTTIMRITQDREMDNLESNLTFLATTGSVSPFVGLFGTVWGIMHSFTAIAQSQSTSLVAVAPGIAEALFATAVGLLAAIPAVIGYNKLQGDIVRYGSRLASFSDELHNILSRQLDHLHH